jgi:hypothetical protein
MTVARRGSSHKEITGYHSCVPMGALIVELQILWEPEEGQCGCCGTAAPKIRSFTRSGRHDRLCFGCWVSMDPKAMTLSVDWDEEECVTFVIGHGPQDIRLLN